GTVTEYTAVSSATWGITTGADGNLWFNQTNGKVGRFTTAGVLTTYSAGLTAEGPITLGLDGYLWTAASTSNIAKITTSGSVTTYSVGTGVQPYGFTVGSDRYVWFTEYGGNTITRVDFAV